MKLKTLIVLSILLQAACGAEQPPAAPGADQERAARPATGLAGEADAARPGTGTRAAGTERIQLAQADTSGDAAVSSRFENGTHYRTLSPVQPTSTGPEQVEVAEFFMYSCIHCYNFDPYLEQWKTSIPDYVNFVRVPTVWNPLVRLHARGFYTAEALGKVEEMHADFFREIHVNGNALQTEEAMAEFFSRYGVSEGDFDRTFNSFAVHAKVQRADELARRYRISSTPSIVINGKYTTNASMAGGYDTLLVLMDELAAAEFSGD